MQSKKYFLFGAMVFLFGITGCAQKHGSSVHSSKACRQNLHQSGPGSKANGGVISTGNSPINPPPLGLTGKLQVVYQNPGQGTTHPSTWAMKAASATGGYGSSRNVNSAAVVVNTGSTSTDYLVWITPMPGDTFSPQPIKVTVPCRQLTVVTINYP